jgi:prophage regulatory protein
MNDRIIRRKAVLAKLSISSATLHRRIKDGTIPPPLRLGPNSVGWRESWIDNVIESFETAIPQEVAPGVKKGRRSQNQQANKGGTQHASV